MIDSKYWDEVWENGNYKKGSTAARLVSWMKQFIPAGATINDYGSGMGLAEIELLKRGHKVNMVDISDKALDDQTRALIGENLTYTLCPLESLPDDFPVAEWGICINVLMTVDPTKLDVIMRNMRRTCLNLIIEVYDMNDARLGRQMTLIKGDMDFWAKEMSKYWPVVRPFKSPEHIRRYIVIGSQM